MNNMKFIKLKKQHSGFTLIEVLISITLLSFIMVGVITLINNSTNIKDKTILEDRDRSQVYTALNRIATDIEQIYSPLYFDKQYQNDNKSKYIIKKVSRENFPKKSEHSLLVPKLDSPNPNTITFMTSSNRRRIQNSKQSNYAWVQYTMRSSTIENEDEKRKDGNNELIRYYKNSDIYKDEIDWDSIKPQLLLRHVKSLKLEFWDKKNEKYVSSLEDLEDKDVIRTLKLTLVWIDSLQFENTFTKVIRPLYPYFKP